MKINHDDASAIPTGDALLFEYSSVFAGTQTFEEPVAARGRSVFAVCTTGTRAVPIPDVRGAHQFQIDR
jgi:protein tyrosine phosphatase (PTP) superfamily phosphohydrolase (DUF442 family)